MNIDVEKLTDNPDRTYPIRLTEAEFLAVRPNFNEYRSQVTLVSNDGYHITVSWLDAQEMVIDALNCRVYRKLWRAERIFKEHTK